MQNKRNKRLLACFLTALGLSANSLNASATNGQTRENIKFYFNIGKNCKKRDEKADLDLLAKDINHFVNDEAGENGKPITYYDIASRLKSVLMNILNDRKNWNSKLARDLKAANCSIENLNEYKNYPGDNKGYYPGDNKRSYQTKLWIKNVADGIVWNSIKGGKFTVLRGNIIGAMSKLASKLVQEFAAEDDNVDKELDLRNENKTDTWSVSTCDTNNKEVKNAIQCELYNNGSLVVIGNRPNLELTDYTFNTINEQERKSVKNIIIKGDIRKIRNYAFAGFKNLKRITISNSVEDISFSNGAFNCCENLDEICISENVPFQNNAICDLANEKGLKFRTVKDLDDNHGDIINTWKTGLTIIEKGNEDEEGNEDLDEEHEINDAVHCSLYSDGYLKIKVESNEVDSNKGKLARINDIFDSIPCKEDRIKTRDNVKKVSIIGNVYSIKESFMLCKNLKEITIPNSVKEIEEKAFYRCNSLEKITIPNSVKEIGLYAFGNCNLREITIPDSVAKIEMSAFDNCTNLKEITIPNSVETIDACTFNNCTNLEKITIPNSVKTIGYHAFCDCKSLKEITIPDSVETIEEDAFKSCENLTVKIAQTHPKLNDILTKLKSEGIKVDVVENV